ncbi:LysR substrate-binding domain-containing protein [Amphritea balenae]|uniref:LysR family transcriptional regulator n=1 Tax=Amphritea balenae TaxID=452629 RepID=A0A3P1STW5_9GAMM|nr:LysR substrate-binding domain-containing protein [Amphritea balenae]RRD00488.1 LysR family transcriptional regulator [Amphritea balenae]GGK70330.1 LysR family transcriptional regulator [Amphritea balenae]
MRDLPIALLRTFMVVTETLNLTAAANRLNKAPSTVSMQLNRLEDLVTTPLMERGQHGVRLTATGIQLRSHAQQLLNLHDQIAGLFQHGNISGKVRLGTHDQYASRALPPLLEAFVVNYPEAQLEVFCDHRPNHLTDRLAQGKLDIVLAEMPANSGGGIRLQRDKLVWVGSSSHQIHKQEVIPLAVFEEGCYHREYARKALEQSNKPYRIAFTSQSRGGVLAAVRAGIGIGIIPLHTLESDMRVIEQGLPPLTETDITLFIAENANEATQRLAQTIKENPLFDATPD